MSYKEIAIGEVCKYTTSGGTPKSNINEYYNPPTIPWLKTKEVNYCRIYETETYISEEGLEKSSAKIIPPNSVIVAMYGQGDTAGRVAINKIPLTTNQACCNLIIDEGKANYEFVYYALTNLYSKLVSLKNGGAQPNLNATLVRGIKIPYPDLSIQHRIADILSVYDDLIENNRKQIKLLEEAAQRLYKEWFVDLRFPGHEHTKIVDGLPEGWEYIPLGKIVSYEIGGGWGEDVATGKNECPGFVIRGTDIDGIKQGELLSIPYRFHTQGNLASRKLQDGDIIFEVSGGSKNTGVAKTLLLTKAMLDVWQKPVMCASFCKLIRFAKPQISQYIYDCLQYWRTIGVTQEYEKKSASSIINYRWKDFLEQKCVMLPEESLLQKYCAMSSSFYKQAITNSIIISKATQARDRLLPKLMSGEVEV